MFPIIGIVGGKGRMGQLFASFFREQGIKVLVSDLNTKLTNSELAQKSDITIVSVPIDLTEKTILELLPDIKEGAAIMDFTSIKSIPVKTMLKGKCEVMGMHPMFGNSNPIPGQPMILCPTRKSAKWSIWMEKFLIKNKVKVSKMSAEEHDKVTNISQGLIHFADIAFADSIRRMKIPTKEIFQYCGPASQLKIQLAARLIDQDSGLYGNIQIQNPHTLTAIKQCQKSVDELAKIVEKKDLAAFKKYFAANKQFFGKYTHEAYLDSSYLIDKFYEKKRKRTVPKPVAAKRSDIAVLGPHNTFSHQAGEQYSKAKKYFARTIDEIFELVASGKVAEGIVPIENNLHGTVREAVDGLFYYDVYIAEEFIFNIHHQLITLNHSKKSDIKKVISKLEALNQCKKYLKKQFPNADLMPFASTAAAADKLLISQDKTLAVIASAFIVKNPELKIMDADIEDEQNNQTTFLVIRRGKTPQNTKGTKTSIAFHFDKDSPGSLFTVFEDFAKAKLNLTKIESRPAKSDFGDYIFYLDFEGGIQEAKVNKVLKSVTSKVAKLKILGSYTTWT